MQAVTQANTALNGIQNLERAKQAANKRLQMLQLNTKQKEALKAQVTSASIYKQMVLNVLRLN